MSFTQTLNYDNAGNFTFDSSLIAIVGSSAQLNLMNNPGQVFTQTYASSSGFTYDPAKTEFTGGAMQQKDTRPTDATFFAALTSAANANWANGSLTGTATGQVTYGVTGANLSAAVSQYIDYVQASNYSPQVGTLRFLFTPLFTGDPGDYQFLFVSSQTNNSINGLFDLIIDPTSSLHIRGFNSGGTPVFDNTLSTPSWVANQTYEVEIDYDFNAGAIRVFLDGVQQGSTQASAISRGTIGLVRFGTAFIVQAFIANFSISNILFFSTVQHTSDYSAPSPVPNSTIYVADEITLPAFNYTSVGDIIAFTVASITDANAPHYTLNGRYWNGSAWVVSNLSYAQSNAAATIIANIATLPVSDMVSVKVITQGSNTSQMSCDLLTLTYTGQHYSNGNPTIINNSGVESDSLLEFIATLSATGSDAVKFVLNVQSVDKYWNGIAWATSNGTYAQANTVADIADNITELDVSQGYTIKVKAFLHSNDGTTTPTLTDVMLTYDFFNPPPTDPNRCIAYAYLNDLIGTLGPTQNALLIVELVEGFAYGDRIIAPYIRNFTVDTSGYVETTEGYLQTPDATASTNGIIETETLDISPYKITIQYTNSNGNQVNIINEGIQIPNQNSVNLVDLLTVLSP